MAKVSFTKLGLKKNEDVEIVEWNEQKIEGDHELIIPSHKQFHKHFLN